MSRKRRGYGAGALLVGLALLLGGGHGAAGASAPAAPLLTPPTTPCPAVFGDVPPGHPFFAYIRCLACQGIIGGYSGGPPCPDSGPCFLPAAGVTRGQLAKFVANAAGYADAIPPAQQTFTDVPAGNPYWLYVERAARHGVISGYSGAPPCLTAGACFLPGRPVTRGQVAKLVAQAGAYTDPIPAAQQTFSDVPTSHPFWVYIERVVLHGVVAGYTFRPPCPGAVPCFLPGTNVTRGQSSKFIANTFYPACSMPSPTPPSPTRTAAPPAGAQVSGYFTEWGIYARNYHVKNLLTSGAAGKMTRVLYAFSNIQNGQCALGDSYADYDRFYDAAGSVSGQPDSWDPGALRGNFHQLQELRALYPTLHVSISIGGWTWSGGFPAVAATAASRQAFVHSCLQTFLVGNFATGLQYPGIFDGVDVDWEYPGAADAANYTALLAEFRSQLDALGAPTGQHYALTIAAPAGSDHFNVLPLSDIHPYLDYIHLMTYDLHGTWETTTNFHAPLYHAAGDPSPPPANTYYADYAVQAYKAAGVPAGKLALGIPFYGRGWTNVPNVNNGLYQPSSSPAPGTYEQGIEDYHVLKNLAGYSTFRHPEAQAFWVFNGTTFWSFDDPASVTNKMTYARAQGLGGAMFWEASGDDASGSLVDAIYSGLR